jgi:hypothetical protein
MFDSDPVEFETATTVTAEFLCVDGYFYFRWLLLEMKREFPFDTALKALEVTWSSLPPATADTKVLSPVIVLFRAVDPDPEPIRIQGFDDKILKK